MLEQAVFDLEGVDVFAAADDEVFDAAGDGYVAVWGEGAFVAGLGVLGLHAGLRTLQGEKGYLHASKPFLYHLPPSLRPCGRHLPSTLSSRDTH